MKGSQVMNGAQAIKGAPAAKEPPAAAGPQGRALVVSILSLSLLTVMAGAAIAPALDVIQAHFADRPAFLIQMIVSVPAIFIVIGNALFPKLSHHFGAKSLCMLGLILYVAGGCSAGLFDSIWLVLILRAFVGLGCGIIMPLSTGLLSFYFPPSRLNKLMGLSSAMNQMGGVIATLLAGVLAQISWRCAFLVYLMGVLCGILCLIFLPNDRLAHSASPSEAAAPRPHAPDGGPGKTLRGYWPNILAMFLLMTTFFIYPTNFAMVSITDGIIPHSMITLIMAAMDFVAFFGGLAFAGVRKRFGSRTKYAAGLIFLAGYLLLALSGGRLGIVCGSLLIGFANGLGIPFLMADASAKAGRSAVTTVIPLLSAALYMAQFVCPMITSLIQNLFGGAVHAPWYLACAAALLLLLVSRFIGEPRSAGAIRESSVPFTIEGIMKKDVYAISETASLIEALEMIVSKRISGMPVIDGTGKLTGFLSDGDILRYMAGTHPEFTNPYAYIAVPESGKEFDEVLRAMQTTRVSDIASQNVLTVDVNDSIPQVCDMFASHHIKKAPVMSDGVMVGVINVSNLTKQAFARYVSAVQTK